MTQRFVLDNAQLWIGDGNVYEGHATIAGTKIEAIKPGRYDGPLPATDLQGQSLSPGMIDLMVLGAFNKNILRDDPLDIAREYLKLGVTGFQLCLGTLSWEGMRQVAENAAQAHVYDEFDAAKILGLYMEGPFQDPECAGANLKEYTLPPSVQNVHRIVDELGDIVTTVNVSPGTPGDAEAVRIFTRSGKRVSMAHSNAPADRVLACVDAGTSVLGHAWDNNAGLIGDSGVQQPTIEQVALTDDRITTIHIICDGTHVHPIMIQLMLRCRGIETICLVTDSNQRGGCPDGIFIFNDGRECSKAEGVCRTPEGWLAGSATLLPDMFRNFVKFTNIEPSEAIQTVTYNPARSLGLDSQMGLLATGRTADLVAWDEKLCVCRVWRAGEEIPNVSNFSEVCL